MESLASRGRFRGLISAYVDATEKTQVGRVRENLLLASIGFLILALVRDSM